MRTFDWVLVAAAVWYAGWQAYQAGWLGTLWGKVKPLLPGTASASEVAAAKLAEEDRQTRLSIKASLEKLAANSDKAVKP